LLLLAQEILVVPLLNELRVHVHLLLRLLLLEELSGLLGLQMLQGMIVRPHARLHAHHRPRLADWAALIRHAGVHLHVAHAWLSLARPGRHWVRVGHLGLHGMVGVRRCHHLAVVRSGIALAGLVTQSTAR
jgi:hypothetical protein